MTTELCGIILHPAGHTLSPRLHQTAYRELNLDAHYHVFDVRSDALRAAVVGMRALGLRQLSVSLPLKEAVMELADEVSAAAREIGAANTLTRTDGRLIADNTDWLGVMRTLEAVGHWQDRSALVLGAGGAARAVVYALRKLGMSVAVHNRTRSRAQKLAADLGIELAELDTRCDLLVNATSVGMQPDVDATPFPEELLRPEMAVFDAVYRPLETRLLGEAGRRGCLVHGGLDMLVHQAAEQVRLWSGRRPSAARMRAAALEHLASTDG